MSKFPSVGSVCGCGPGQAGCAKCGACRLCAEPGLQSADSYQEVAARQLAGVGLGDMVSALRNSQGQSERSSVSPRPGSVSRSVPVLHRDVTVSLSPGSVRGG